MVQRIEGEPRTETLLPEKVDAWVKKHARVLFFGAALFAAGQEVGIHKEKQLIEQASEDRIEEIIKNDKNLNNAEIIDTQYLETKRGAEIMTGIRLGTGAVSWAKVEIDKEGNLLGITFAGESLRGGGYTVAYPENKGENLHVVEKEANEMPAKEKDLKKINPGGY